jgi:hypothetical protein
MNPVTTTRRGALAIFAAAPATIAAASVPLLQISPFRAAVDHWHAIDAVRDRYYNETFEPAYKAWLAAREQQDNAISAVPHVRTTASYANMVGGRSTMSTEVEWHVSLARREIARADFGGSDGSQASEYDTVLREVAKAADERDAAIERIKAAHPLPNVPDEDGGFGGPVWTALQDAAATPAGNAEELAEKTAIMRRENLFEHEDLLDAFLRDVASLVGAA